MKSGAENLAGDFAVGLGVSSSAGMAGAFGASFAIDSKSNGGILNLGVGDVADGGDRSSKRPLTSRIAAPILVCHRKFAKIIFGSALANPVEVC